MGLLSPRKRVNNVMYPSSHGYPYFISNVAGSPVKYVSAGNALKNSDVYSSVNRISSDIASAMFKTENSWAKQMLDKPSNIVSRFSFWQGVIVQLLLSGNAYVPITEAGYLEQVPPSDVQIDYLPGNKAVQYTVIENNERPKLVLKQSEMLHFRLLPDASYRYLIGMSPLESLEYEMNISESTKKMNLNAATKQINPSGVLNFKDALLSPEDKDNAREEFEKANAGSKSGSVMILDNNSEFKQFEIKADVFKALTDNAGYSAGQIAKAFGIPVDMLGGGASTESQHSNIDQIKSVYLMNLNQDVNPIVDELRLKLNAPDLELDIRDMLDVDDSLLISQLTQLKSSNIISSGTAQNMLIRAGFVTPDVIVDEPMKGGDTTDDSEN